MPDPEMRPPAWLGLLARAGTPPAVLQRLETEARASIQSPAMRDRLEALALEPVGSSSADFKRMFEASEPVMARLIKMSGAKVE
ncbi:Tripartite tricarboxylate transporter family receptor [compost metagenome]